jgi:hypothetical protein
METVSKKTRPSTENFVKAIRRKTRRLFTSEQKILIVMEAIRGESLTTALGLGKQGSKQHKDLIKRYFPSDKAAKAAITQDCYLRPSGASIFSDYQYLTLTVLTDTIKVSYSLMIYDHGKTDLTKSVDIYVLQDHKFKTLKRKIWAWADRSLVKLLFKGKMSLHPSASFRASGWTDTFLLLLVTLF